MSTIKSNAEWVNKLLEKSPEMQFMKKFEWQAKLLERHNAISKITKTPMFDSIRTIQNQINVLRPFNKLGFSTHSTFNQIFSDRDIIKNFNKINSISSYLKLSSSFLLSENWKELLIDELNEDEETEINKEPSIILLNDTIRVKGIIKSIYDDNNELFKIRPRDFEFVIAELLENKGLKVELTKETRDGGYDVLAIQDLGYTKNKYLVECKRNRADRPVDINVVRQMLYSIDRYKANKGMIFTTSYYTSVAKKEQELNHFLLDLKDGIDVVKWIQEHVKPKPNVN